MIIGFDWDGTLVRSFTNEPLPGVRERLHALPSGTRTFIATNQAGPVFRAMLRDTKYPTSDNVVERIGRGLYALDWKPDLLLVCTYPGKDGPEWLEAAVQAARHIARLFRGWDGLRGRVRVSSATVWRKPEPVMLLEAARHFGVAPADLLFVGDMDSDEQAAAAAGARFVGADAWRSS